MEPINEIVVWDLETTGFVAPECRILEIGAYLINGDLIEKKHWVINEGIEIPEKIVEITGITKEIVEREGRPARECLDEFLPLLMSAKKNITHNGIRFDIPFLTNYAQGILDLSDFEKRQMVDYLRKTAFDTAVAFKARKIDLKQRAGEAFVDFADRVMEVRAFGVKYNLALCCEESKIDISNMVLHRALADVHLTHLIYKTLPVQGEVQDGVQEDTEKLCTCFMCCNERGGITGVTYSEQVLQEHENIKKGLPF